MRKIYLFIMAALLLIGSGNLLAASYTYNKITYETEDALWEAIRDNPSVTIKVGAESDLTIPAGKTVILQMESSAQNNGTFTNNGTLKPSTSATWNNGTFINNGTLIISGATWNSVTELTNNGTFTINGGKINTELLENFINNCGATIENGYESTIYYEDENYTQILKTTSIEARITKDGGIVYAFAAINIAMNYSSVNCPAVLQKDVQATSVKNIKVSDGKDKYIDLNGYTIKISYNNNIISNGSLTITGTGNIEVTSNSIKSAFWLKGSDVPTSEPYASLTIGENVTINCTGNQASAISIDQNGNSKKSYGVVVNIDGKIKTTEMYALYINGNVNAVDGNVPEINIANGASVETFCNGDAACIYAAGYGIWNIGAATLKAGTPIYAKSGQININGATIEACGEYAEPQPYGNGFYGTGDGIVFDSKNGYAGNMSIAITDATITSANGYAIQEVLTDREESQTLSMQILDGKFKGYDSYIRALWRVNTYTLGI